MKSKLPNSVLRRIWALSDIDNDGQLDRDEFALAMFLLDHKLSGNDLPDVLPEKLVPPSKRMLFKSSHYGGGGGARGGADDMGGVSTSGYSSGGGGYPGIQVVQTMPDLCFGGCIPCWCLTSQSHDNIWCNWN